MEPLVVLGLGSNRGNSPEILREAVRELGDILRDIRISPVYRTTPQDYADQDEFLNLVVSGHTSMPPGRLLAAVNRIEARSGRDRSTGIPGGPRTLDIDIELYGNLVVTEPDLVIPHPRMHQRQFVLVPMLSILPDCADPVSGKPYRDILADLPDQGVVKVGDLYGN